MRFPTVLAHGYLNHTSRMWPFLLSFLPLIVARCYDPEPAFPVPSWDAECAALQDAFRFIEATVQDAVFRPDYKATSLSIEVTSAEDTLWSFHHTALIRNNSRLGTPTVTGDSVYRIASITKTFTVLGILKQHAAGNLSLDDSIQVYIVELQGPQNGTIPWKDITLRSLASQLSGIPREYSFFDLGTEIRDPTEYGLPPLSDDDLPPCGVFDGTPRKHCSRQDYLDGIKQMKPIFAPNQKSTYSNIAFILLGLALENVTGTSYTDYVKSSIFEPLGMNHSSFDKPDDSIAVLPLEKNYWDVDLGITKPAGGIYSSCSDLSRYLRYILTHYNGITPALNWLNPVSYSGGTSSFYGIPWEIYRTSSILSYTTRATTFVTKGGALPGYFSMIFLIPEYNIGMTVLVAGNFSLLLQLAELMTGPLVRALDAVAQEDLHKKYTGTYRGSVDAPYDSSLVLDHTLQAGLFVRLWRSNGTDVMSSLVSEIGNATHGPDWRAQLVPTLLYRNETAKEGELWRIEIVANRPESGASGMRVWDEACHTDIDLPAYGGKPLFEVVFFIGDRGRVDTLELTGFRQTLHWKVTQQEDFVVQS